MRIMSSIIVALLLPFTFAACGPEASAEPIRGTYIDADEKFEAEITEDEIVIYIVGNGTKSLYWDGTWSESDTVVSKADKKALEASFTGSTSPAKTFTVDDGEVTFEFGIMGTVTDVTLEEK